MGDNNRPVAVVVDGYSSGNHLPAAFAALGVDAVHIRSTPELLTAWRQPEPTAYQGNLMFTSLEESASRLAAFSPLCVVAGQEPGVMLADRLSERLGLATNGTALSAARRDKYEMIEALRRAGVRCARQLESGDAGTLVAWAEATGYPVVVKPLASAASDGVAICRTREEVRAAVEGILRTPSIFDDRNHQVLVRSSRTVAPAPPPRTPLPNWRPSPTARGSPARNDHDTAAFAAESIRRWRLGLPTLTRPVFAARA